MSPPAKPIIDEYPGVTATAAQVLAWAEDARPGAEFVYASRAGLMPRGMDAARVVGELAGRGLVHPKQRPISGTHQRNYIAERSSKPWTHAPEPRPARTTPYRAASGEAEAINAIYPILARAAQFGRPCPTDAQLSERSGIEREAIQPTLLAMSLIGMIRTEPAKAPTLRLVTIVATGHRTGLVA